MLFATFIGFLLVFVTFQSVFGQQPVLIPELPMHRSLIRTANVTSAGTRMAALSDDGAILFWDVEETALLRTLYLPFSGPKPEPAVAMALSPSGGRLFAAGTTRDELTGQLPLYLFEPQTGTLLDRWLLPVTSISALQITSDGSLLLVSGTSGILGLEAVSGSARFQHTFFTGLLQPMPGNSSNWMLATGQKLYLSSGNGVFSDSLPLPILSKPTAFSVNENGDVGLLWNEQASFYTLSFSKKTISAPVSSKNHFVRIDRVLAQKNGSFWIAGLDLSAKPGIKKWDAQSGFSPKNFPIPGAVTQLSALPNDALLITGTAPFWSVLKDNTMLPGKSAELMSFNRSDRSNFVVSESGLSISIHPTSGDPVHFSMALRGFSPEKTVGRSARDQFNDNVFKNGRMEKSAVWNGRNLESVLQGDRVYSSDIGNNADLAVGTQRHILLLSRDARLKLRLPVPSIVWNIRISDSGAFLIAALGDGTIRWYDAETGREKWALLMTADLRKWLVWTPDGFFDASPGAASLISWLIPRGNFSEPLVFPADRFSAQRHRPDSLDRRMGLTIDKPSVVKPDSFPVKTIPITAQLPPVVKIISPVSGAVFSSPSFSFRLTIESPDSVPVQNVHVFLDGRPIEISRKIGISTSKTEQTLDINLPKRDCIVSFVAQNKFGFSKPELVSLRWGGASEKNLLKPTLYVLSIGAGNYKGGIPPLTFPSKDAHDFASVLKKQKGLLYKDVVVRELNDSSANKTNILDGFEWIQRQTTSRDVAMIFMAGHGMNDANGVFYFVPSDAELDAVKRTCVVYADIKNTITAIAGKVIFFIDACHSGNIMGERRGGFNIDAIVNDLASAENGVVVFTSSTGRQYSLEKAEWGNGAFTKALVEGLSGKADLFSRNVVSVKTLDAYVADRVKVLTNGQQSPTMIIPQSIPDYPIVLTGELK